MTISKLAFVSSIVTAVAAGVAGGIMAGIKIGKNKSQKELDEANAMVEFWKKRAERVREKEGAEKISEPYTDCKCSETEPTLTEMVAPKPLRNVSRDYTKYYSRKETASDEEEEDVISVDPKPNINDPPRIVSQDEAMADDSDCLELEYHTKDEVLLDPNAPGHTEVVDPTDAFMMVGNLLRVPDPSTLPKTVYIYSPKRDQYYEIYIYDNYWDPPDEYDDDEAPRVEKIKKRGRFDD